MDIDVAAPGPPQPAALLTMPNASALSASQQLHRATHHRHTAGPSAEQAAMQPVIPGDASGT